MAKRASPGIGRTGHNSLMPTHTDVRSALAIDLIFEEEKKKLNERHKRAKKKIEGMGVRRDDMKFLKGCDGKTGSEVIEEFKRQWHLVGAMFEEQHEQYDLFAPKASAPAVRAAHYTLGLLKGLKGEDMEIPPAVVGDDRQQFTAGFNEGAARRAAAWEAIAESDGQKVVDGTGKTPSPAATAAAVGKRAEQDFAKDQGDNPLIVGGVTYPNMRQAIAARKRLEAGPQTGVERSEEQRPDDSDPGEQIPGEAVVAPGGCAPGIVVGEASDADKLKADNEVVRQVALSGPKVPIMRPVFDDWDADWTKWTGVQTMQFRRWFESMPHDHVPLTVHEGVIAFWRLLKEERDNVASGGVDDEAWDEATPARQEAELPDPDEVAKAAAKLKESGFVETKKGRGRPKNLAKA